MKKSINLVIVAFVAFALTLSSCKKGDEPTPAQPSTTTPTTPPVVVTPPTPNAPTVTIPTPTADANGTTITVNATDTDGIQSVVITGNGTTTTLTAPYSYNTGALANGSYIYHVKVTDNTGLATEKDVTFTVSNGTVTPSAKTVTETKLSTFLSPKVLSDEGSGTGNFNGTLTIGSNGSFVTSATQATGGFFGTTVASGATKTYTVDSNGYLVVSIGSPYNITCSYEVSINVNNKLQLTQRTTQNTYVFQ